MKSGTGDDPFSDASTEESEDADKSDDGAIDASEGLSEPVTETAGSASASPEIPYKFRRDSVKADRKQRPIFLRPEVESRENEFIRTLEDELDEDVYKTDALEAAIIVAMDNPELVADELRDWGYDWE